MLGGEVITTPMTAVATHMPILADPSKNKGYKSETGLIEGPIEKK